MCFADNWGEIKRNTNTTRYPESPTNLKSRKEKKKASHIKQIAQNNNVWLVFSKTKGERCNKEIVLVSTATRRRFD